MKLYLAARNDRRQDMRDMARRLQSAGHVITAVWFYRFDVDVSEPRSAIEAVEGVRHADCLVSFTEQPPERLSWAVRAERHVEFGLAVAFGKRLCLVGPREHVLHHLPRVELYASAVGLIEGLSSPAEVAP